jgi:hypothetical protein
LQKFGSVKNQVGRVWEGRGGIVRLNSGHCPRPKPSSIYRGPQGGARTLRGSALAGVGEPVDVMTLIPHTLEAFMARDRGFRRGSGAKLAVG